ncbi:hypothetical protein PMAYCL1PPCAC_10000 [Pristionchus mayeri]|uniref:Uncharacterized protein n=1 Tax=Pristionchus mayeri TaxID=1317129 RepID=A0AAN4ZLF5_9BILA|nr:hypothetical protein PMAYCL1PPCAC_10000 [Pristionchus mayeri]
MASRSRNACYRDQPFQEIPGDAASFGNNVDCCTFPMESPCFQALLIIVLVFSAGATGVISEKIWRYDKHNFKERMYPAYFLLFVLTICVSIIIFKTLVVKKWVYVPTMVVYIFSFLCLSNSLNLCLPIFLVLTIPCIGICMHLRKASDEEDIADARSQQEATLQERPTIAAVEQQRAAAAAQRQVMLQKTIAAVERRRAAAAAHRECQAAASAASLAAAAVAAKPAASACVKASCSDPKSVRVPLHTAIDMPEPEPNHATLLEPD